MRRKKDAHERLQDLLDALKSVLQETYPGREDVQEAFQAFDDELAHLGDYCTDGCRMEHLVQ